MYCTVESIRGIEIQNWQANVDRNDGKNRSRRHLDIRRFRREAYALLFVLLGHDQGSEFGGRGHGTFPRRRRRRGRDAAAAGAFNIPDLQGALSAFVEERKQGHDELARDVDAHIETNQLQDQNAVRPQVVLHEIFSVVAGKKRKKIEDD